MKHFSVGLAALFFFAGSMMTSCSKEDIWGGSDTEGKISLSLETDGTVRGSTRADDTQATVVPDPKDFSISLNNKEGSYSKKWNNLDAFNEETLFKTGEYVIEAEYGDPEKEGFDSPYYYVGQDVTVVAGEDAQISLTATLANAMVSVRFTDEFKSNFSAYSTALRSEGHDYIVLAQEETRPVYVSPSKIELSLTMTNRDGKEVTVQPAGFTAEARHHYIVTIGVNGDASLGNLTLDIQFTEDVDSEVIEVPLGEELFNAPPPFIEAKGFVSDEPVEHIESMPYEDEDPRFQLFAFAGFKEARLIINSTGDYTPAFGREIELVAANETQKSQVTGAGVEVTGLFRNPDKMAVVGFRKFLEQLPHGEYEMLMEVKDAMTRTNDINAPVRFKVLISDLKVEIVPVGKMKFNSREHDFYVFSNFKGIVRAANFRRLNRENTEDALIVDADAAISVDPATVGNEYAGFAYGYKCHFKIPDSAFVGAFGVQKDQCLLRIYYKNETTPRASTPLALEFPKYTLQADAMARKVKIRIIPENPEDLGTIKSCITFFYGDTETNDRRLFPLRGDVVEVHEMISNHEYTNVTSTLGDGINRTSFSVPVPDFKTEQELPIPNGNFAQTHQTINEQDVQIGGKYEVKVLGISGSYARKSSIVRSEADNWASVNSFTCYPGSKNRNTWFMVPSTYVENGIATIRTVGFNHNGENIATSGGKGNTNYYCENSPSEDKLAVRAGEMFLGSYLCDNTGEHREEGVDFGSRPRSLKFSYNYSPLNGEEAECVVKMYKGEKNKGYELISETRAKLASTSGGWVDEKWIEFNACPFDDGTSGPKITKIVVMFISSTAKNPSLKFPTKEDLEKNAAGVEWSNFTNPPKMAANAYTAFASGSVLQVKNVEFKYTTQEHSVKTKAVKSHRVLNKTRR